ncbi:NADH oxidase, partial [Burkholderia pseudomallei]
PPVRLRDGVTRHPDLVPLQRQSEVALPLPGYAYRTSVADEASSHPRKGYVSEHVEPYWLNGGDVYIYLFGAAAMVDAVQAWLSVRGVT